VSQARSSATGRSWSFLADATGGPYDPVPAGAALRLGTNPSEYGMSFQEDLAYLRAGIDGMFCDQPDICLPARSAILTEGERAAA